MAWQHTFEKKGYGHRAERKEGSKATRGNINRAIEEEPIGAGNAKKRKVFKRFGIECMWFITWRNEPTKWRVWSWYETEKQRAHALALFRRRSDILKRQYRIIDR